MSAKITFPNLKNRSLATKRGDTIIEVMFAIAVFSLVAVLTISMMNLGTANAEGSLELTTARHELNSQAEALRFIHSAYTAELALPECNSGVAVGEKCQHYDQIWDAIAGHALEPKDLDLTTSPLNRIINITDTLNNNDTSGGPDYGGAVGCRRAYEPGQFGGYGGGTSLLAASRAFVLNVRDLSITDDEARIRPNSTRIGQAIISATDSNISTDPDATNADIKFTPAPLSARIIYAKDGHPNETTKDGYAVRNSYNRVSRVEGIWVVAIAGNANGAAVPPFYDFYIQTCWNAPNSLTPTILDTVIRLYNPGAK